MNMEAVVLGNCLVFVALSQSYALQKNLNLNQGKGRGIYYVKNHWKFYVLILASVNCEYWESN